MLNRISILLVCMAIFASSVHCQTKYKRLNADGLDIVASAAETDFNDEFCRVGILPEFPGGTDSLVAFAKRHIIYPESAVNDSVSGKVVLAFFVNESGKVVNPAVVKGVRSDLDTPCLKMLEQMPYWKPGMLNEGPVEVKFMVAIVFVLTD